MKFRTIIAATAVGAMVVAAAPVAGAQTPPISDPTTIGGNVFSSLELIITQPKSSGFAKFPRAKTYSTAFDVSVITTDPVAQLSLADGEVARGSKMGKLASGSKALPLPLEARVGKAAFAPLNQPVDPMLTRWTEAQARTKATVNLRQKVKGKASGSYRKVLLVTLSTDSP